MKKIDFTKMEASGNDFVVISGLKKGLNELAKKMCGRRHSIGADGLLAIEESKKGDFRMRIFNPDGSEPDMCGNGLRCAARYALENGIAGERQKVQTGAGILEVEVKGDSVKVKMSEPKDLELGFNLEVKGDAFTANFVNTGVPHVVYFVDDLAGVDIKGAGSATRYHERFKPDGTNANFVKVTGKNSIQIRTYERGVEDETLACGTGSVASAIIASAAKGVKPPVDVHTAGGSVLKISFSKGYKELYMEGDAKIIYQGVFNYV